MRTGVGNGASAPVVIDTSVSGGAAPEDGGGIVIPDAATLFNGTFSHSGPDLVISHGDGPPLLVPGYFAGDAPPALFSPQGAMLSGDTVAALAGPRAPGQYAQAGQVAGGEPIGTVETVTGGATAMRANGTLVQLAEGDPVYQGDVVQTAAGSSLSITFVDDTVFSLSADARMVLDELVYSPGGADNSMVMNLVQGTFVFVTGQVAPTGDMRIETPVATMGIRGTTPVVQISAVDGATRFSLSPDPDGTIGSYVLYDKVTGQVVGTVSSIDRILSLTSIGQTPQEDAKSPIELEQERQEVERAYEAYRQSQSSQQNQQQQDDGQNGGQNGNPNGGIQTDSGGVNDSPNGNPQPLNNSNSPLGPLNGQGGNGSNLLDGGGPQNNGSLGNGPSGGPGLTNPQTTPSVSLATVSLSGGPITTNEDAAIVISGLSISGPGSGLVTVSMTAFSTITLAQTTGLFFTFGDGIGGDDHKLIFSGTTAAVNAALNGFTYTPTQDSETGGLTILVTNAAGTTTTTIPITITPQPDAPSVGNIGLTVTEGDTVPGLFVGDDPDVGDTLTLSLLSTPSAGTLDVNSNGTFTFDTDSDFDYLAVGEQAQVSFQYKAVDNDGLESVPGTVTITINGANDSPVLGPAASLLDGFETGFGGWSTTVNASLVAGGTEGSQHARLTTFGALGEDSLEFSEPPTVASVGEIEELFGLAGGTFNDLIGVVAESPGATSGGVLQTTIDVSAGDIITFDWRFSSEDYVRSDGFTFDDFAVAVFGGNVVKLADVSLLGNLEGDAATTGWQTFSFVAPETGTFDAGFAVLDFDDEEVVSALDIDNIRVGENTTAVITELPGNSPYADTLPHFVEGLFTFTDADSADTHTVSVTPQGTGYRGTLTPTLLADSTGGGTGFVKWQFTVADSALDDLDFGESLVQSYEVTVDDGNGGTVSRTVTVTLNGANEAPVVDVSGISPTATDEDTPLILSGVTVSDPDAGADPLEVSLSVINGALTLTGPATGLTFLDSDGTDGAIRFSGTQAAINAALAGSIHYTPDADFYGEDILSIRVSDQAGTYVSLSDVAEVAITIAPVNDAPVAEYSSFAIPPELPFNGQLAASDPDFGDTLSFFLDEEGGPAYGTLAINIDGSFEYTPDEGFTGFDSFTYVVTDSGDLSDTGLATIAVPDETHTTEAGQTVTLDVDATGAKSDGLGIGNVEIDLSDLQGDRIKIAFAFDASGSMSDEYDAQIEAIQAAIDALRTRFDGSDTQVEVLLVKFASNAADNDPNEDLNKDGVDLFDDSLGNISGFAGDAGGGTNYGPPLDAVRAFFNSDPVADANYLFFTSDGAPGDSQQDVWGPIASDIKGIASSAAFAIGAASSTALDALAAIDSDGEAQQVGDVENLTDAFTGTPLFAAQLVDFSLQLVADGVDHGVVATETDLATDGLNRDLDLAAIPGIGALLGQTNALLATATFDLDGNLATTEDQKTLYSHDLLQASATSVSLSGTFGDDLLFGGIEADTLEGNDGNDVILGLAGDDQITGGLGDDWADGGDGFDTLMLSGADGDYVFSSNGDGFFTVADQRPGYDGTDTFRNIEAVSFANGTRYLWQLVGEVAIAGTAFADTIHGTPANDRIEALGGDDWIFGHEGEDWFVAGEGNDVVDGSGVGDNENEVWDTIDYMSEAGEHPGTAQGVTVNLATGFATDTYGDQDQLVEIERVVGTNFGDAIVGTENDEGFDPHGGADTINGGLGFDQLLYHLSHLYGGDGAITVTFDPLVAGNGTAIDPWGDTDTFTGIEDVRGTPEGDTVIGGAGFQRFRGLAGNDEFDGGAGNDRADYSRDHIYGGEGGIVADLSVVDAQGFATITDGFGHSDHVRNVEQVTGTRHADTITGDGADNDFRGQAGDDALYGGGGDDDLRGEAGNDLIAGGLGLDLLSGGSGSDTFVLAETDFADILTDYQVGVDRLDVSELLAAAFTTQTQADYLQVVFDGTNTILQVDGDGAGGALGFTDVAVLQGVGIGDIIHVVYDTDAVTTVEAQGGQVF